MPNCQHHQEVLKNDPKPLGKRVKLSHYINANLIYDVLLDTVVIYALFMFGTRLLWPMGWFCKKQAMPKTATYG